MQDMKTELLALHNGLNEEEFDLFEFLDNILAIDEHFNDKDIFSSFCHIWGIEEAQDWEEFDQDTINFVKEVQDAPYVDVENFKELYFKDIKDRLEVIVNIL